MLFSGYRSAWLSQRHSKNLVSNREKDICSKLNNYILDWGRKFTI